MTTHNDLEQVVNWIIANESNGDFSRDAWQFITRFPINKREIPIIRTNVSYPCILVYGIVHDLIVRASIYLTQYRNVIGIDVPQTPDKSATLYTIDINTVAKFLKEYFDKTPITVFLDNSDGSDTEAY